MYTMEKDRYNCLKTKDLLDSHLEACEILQNKVKDEPTEKRKSELNVIKLPDIVI